MIELTEEFWSQYQNAEIPERPGSRSAAERPVSRYALKARRMEEEIAGGNGAEADRLTYLRLTDPFAWREKRNRWLWQKARPGRPDGSMRVAAMVTVWSVLTIFLLMLFVWLASIGVLSESR